MYRHQRAPLSVNCHPNKEEELHFGLVSYFHKTKLWLPPAGASSETDSTEDFCSVDTHTSSIGFPLTFDLSLLCAYSGKNSISSTGKQDFTAAPFCHNSGKPSIKNVDCAFKASTQRSQCGLTPDWSDHSGGPADGLSSRQDDAESLTVVVVLWRKNLND